MCLAIPGKVKKIRGNFADFDYNGREYSADISLAPEIEKGDWILMHDGRALSKITQEEGEEQLKFIAEHEEMACHDIEKK